MLFFLNLIIKFYIF